MTMKMKSVGRSTRREKVLVIFLFTLITLTSVDCIFANGFIIPYSLASRFFNPSSRVEELAQVTSTSPGRSSAQEKLIRTLKGEQGDPVASRSFVPRIFPFSLPNVASTHSNRPPNGGKNLLNLKLGPNFSSSSSASPQSVSVDLSVLKMPPASSPSSSSFSIASFLPKASFKSLVNRPTSSILVESPAVAAAAPLVPSLDHDLIDEDFLFGDSGQLDRNSFVPSTNNFASFSPHSPSSLSSSSREMRELEERQLRKVLNNLAGATSHSNSDAVGETNGGKLSSSYFLGRQMNPMRTRESRPVINHLTGERAESRSKLNKHPLGHFTGNRSPSSSLSPSLSSGNVITDRKNIPRNVDSGDNDRNNDVSIDSPSNLQLDTDHVDNDDDMMKSIARTVNHGTSSNVRDKLLRQYRVKIGEKAPDFSFDDTRLNDVINNWYGPEDSDGDALTDFIYSQASMARVQPPATPVKTISPSSPLETSSSSASSSSQHSNQSKQSKPIITHT